MGAISSDGDHRGRFGSTLDGLVGKRHKELYSHTQVPEYLMALAVLSATVHAVDGDHCMVT